MSYPASPALLITERQRRLLAGHARRATATRREIFRISIVLNGADGLSNVASARALATTPRSVKEWRDRWASAQKELAVFAAGPSPGQPPSDLELLRYLLDIFDDRPRSGRPGVITEAQKTQIVALSCEEPSRYDLPLTGWTHELIAKTAIDKGIVDKISPRHVGTILKKSTAPT